jgi:hypothetical protein
VELFELGRNVQGGGRRVVRLGWTTPKLLTYGAYLYKAITNMQVYCMRLVLFEGSFYKIHVSCDRQHTSTENVLVDHPVETYGP